MRAIAAAAFAVLALAACSEADKAEVREDANSVVSDVKDSAQDIASSQAVESIKRETKEAANDTGIVLKAGANEVKEGAADVAAMAKERAANVRAEANKDDETTTTTTTTTVKTEKH